MHTSKKVLRKIMFVWILCKFLQLLLIEFTSMLDGASITYARAQAMRIGPFTRSVTHLRQDSSFHSVITHKRPEGG